MKIVVERYRYQRVDPKSDLKRHWVQERQYSYEISEELIEFIESWYDNSKLQPNS